MPAARIPAPPDTVPERASRAKIAALILAGHVRDGLAYPYGVRFSEDSDIPGVHLDFDSSAELLRWMEHLDIREECRQQLIADSRVNLFNTHLRRWHGWFLAMTAQDPVPPPEPGDADTDALLEEVLTDGKPAPLLPPVTELLDEADTIPTTPADAVADIDAVLDSAAVVRS